MAWEQEQEVWVLEQEVPALALALLQVRRRAHLPSSMDRRRMTSHHMSPHLAAHTAVVSQQGREQEQEQEKV